MQVPSIRREPLCQEHPSCFLRPSAGQERTDYFLQTLLDREVSNQFADGKIKYPQPEGAEHGDALGTVSSGGSASENVRQSAPDEVPVPHELFCEVYRSLRAADVIDIIHHVV